MNLLIPKVGRVNGNGHGDVSGRGLRHRVFDDHYARLEEAADVVTDARRYFPAVGETADAYGLSVAELRAHLKAREALQAAANSPVDETSDETKLVASSVKLNELYNQIVRKLGQAKTDAILAAIERANAEIT